MGMSLYIDREHIDTGYEMETMVTVVLMKPSKIHKARSYDANASRFCKIYTKKCKDQSELWEGEFKAFCLFFLLL